jgi:hypothetical protein
MSVDPLQDQQQAAQQGPFAGFDDSVRNDVEGLAWLGHLEDQFDFCGHTFVIRTLKADEELLSTLVIKDYVDTFGQARAWAWARIALALVSIDGVTDFCPPLGPDKTAYAHARFRWVTDQWYWPTGEYLFNKYVALERRQLDAIKEVDSLSKGSPQPSTLSVDSWITPSDSSPQTDQGETSTDSNTDS